MLAISRLQETYGRWLWRWKAPLREFLALRMAPAASVLGIDTPAATAPAADTEPALPAAASAAQSPSAPRNRSRTPSLLARFPCSRFSTSCQVSTTSRSSRPRQPPPGPARRTGSSSRSLPHSFATPRTRANRSARRPSRESFAPRASRSPTSVSGGLSRPPEPGRQEDPWTASVRLSPSRILPPMLTNQ